MTVIEFGDFAFRADRITAITLNKDKENGKVKLTIMVECSEREYITCFSDEKLAREQFNKIIEAIRDL